MNSRRDISRLDTNSMSSIIKFMTTEESNVKRNPSAQNPSDDDVLNSIMSRITLRDQSALAELYDITAGRVFALALRITSQTAAAEEVVSDVYFQVWQMSERYDIDRGRVITWLLTICRSRAIDLLRRRDEAVLHDDPESLRAEAVKTDLEPQLLVETFERDSAVREAIETLTERDRYFVGLAFFRGMTHQEISDYTNTPLGSVKSIIRNALLALREHLQHFNVSENLV